MTAVRYDPNRFYTGKMAPLILGEIKLTPSPDGVPAFNLIEQGAIDRTLANPFFKQKWEQMLDMGVVQLLDTPAVPEEEKEPPLPDNLTKAVSRIKETGNVQLLERWKVADERPGVQKAIDAQLLKINPPEPGK